MVIDERGADTYQQAFPTSMCTMPSTNVVTSAQRTVTLSMYRKRFESPELCWHDDFTMFMKNRVAKKLQEMNEEMLRFKSIFYRTYMFHNSPSVAFLGGQVQVDEGAPAGVGNALGTTGKTNAYLANQISNMTGNMGRFTLSALRSLSGYLADANIMPAQTGMQKENAAIDDKYTIMIENSEYRGLADDPLVCRQSNASIADFNLVNGSFRGMLLGQFNVMPHNRGLRIWVNPDGTIEFPRMEEIILNGPYKGRPRTTDKYAKAQIGVGFIIGDKGYSIVDPGAPPEGWKQMDSKGNGIMWHGRPVLTDRFMVDCIDPVTEAVTREFNTYGDKMKWIAEDKMGIVGLVPHNVLTFLYLRRNAADYGLWPQGA